MVAHPDFLNPPEGLSSMVGAKGIAGRGAVDATGSLMPAALAIFRSSFSSRLRSFSLRASASPLCDFLRRSASCHARLRCASDSCVCDEPAYPWLAACERVHRCCNARRTVQRWCIACHTARLQVEVCYIAHVEQNVRRTIERPQSVCNLCFDGLLLNNIVLWESHALVRWIRVDVYD